MPPFVFGNRRRISAGFPMSDSESSEEDDDPALGEEENEITEENEIAEDGYVEPFEKLEEFFSDYENAVPPAPGAIPPHILEAYDVLERTKEKRYQKEIKVESVVDDDFRSYSNVIATNLKRIASCLKIRRKRACINYIAVRFNYPPLPLIEEIDDYLTVLNREESSEIIGLIGERSIQIRDSKDLDTALYLIKGNEDPGLLPIFLLPNRSFFDKLQQFARGRFSCMVKEEGIWNEEIEYFGCGDVDVDPAVAAGDGSESSLGKIMDRLTESLMIVSDLDHNTMVDHHDPENLSLLKFNALWEAIYRSNSLLVFSTWRSLTLYKELRKEKPMLTPDISIMSLGTEIMYGNSMELDNGWAEVLNQNWDRSIVLEETSKITELTLQSETEQGPHKVSFYVQKDKAEDITKSLSTCLKERGLDAKIIYSGGTDLDILPQGAGKGQALAYLHDKFKSEGKLPNNTLVCGDSGNDADLFTIPDVHGVMVSNAQEELLQWYTLNAKNNPKIVHAKERCAAGIIQAIDHFNLGPSISPRDVEELSKLDYFDPAYEVVMFYLFYERWRLAEVSKSEVCITKLKAVCSKSGVFVHPSGVEMQLHDCVDSLKACFGDKKGKPFCVWVDQVLPFQVGSDAWLVKFKKYEQSGEQRLCCLTTALLSSKDVTVAEGLTWVHIHQTWLKDARPSSDTDWLF